MFTGKLIKVKDGDTYVVDYQQIHLTIRLGNVDCPERTTPFGKEVIANVRELIEGKLIDFETLRLDTHGRYVCNVFIDGGRRLDELLVANGWAWHYERYSTNKNLIAIERKAFDEKRGIWNPHIIQLYYGTLWQKQQSF